MTNTTLTYMHDDQPIELELDNAYDLAYVDYRDELSPEQVAMIVRGDTEALFESVWEFDADVQYRGAEYVADELLREVEIDPKDFEPYGELIDEIRERDCSDVIGELVKHTPAVLLRVAVIDEDHGYSFETVEPARVLADVGLEPTEDNLRTIARALAECSPEYSVLMGYWVLGADVSDLYRLPSDPSSEVEITNPYLYLGNPFAGSGFITETPLEGTVLVKRGELRTDKDAFGYSLNEVYGGLYPSSFECEIKPATVQRESVIERGEN